MLGGCDVLERFFILDKYNTWFDWGLIVTSKDITPPEPKTNYVEIDGMSGSLDLTESLTDEPIYKNRTITATFWTNNGTRNDRTALLREITTALHGKKIKIVEPDDSTHYFYGRPIIKSTINNVVYTEFTIEITCDPWRYAINETNRKIIATNESTDVIIKNNGVKTLTPLITVSDGTVEITYGDITKTLQIGSYKISDLRLKHGSNLIGVSGDGTVIFTYTEADL